MPSLEDQSGILEISEQTYHRWRKRYGGLKADDAKRLKELGHENTRLKRIVADKELEIDALREIAKGKLLRPSRRRREEIGGLVERRIDANRTNAALEDLVKKRGGPPAFIRCDNGPELTANALRDWCRFSGTGTSYIEPVSPWENPFVESFGSRLRDELLSTEQLDTLLEAQVLIGDWKHDTTTTGRTAALAGTRRSRTLGLGKQRIKRTALISGGPMTGVRSHDAGLGAARGRDRRKYRISICASSMPRSWLMPNAMTCLSSPLTSRTSEQPLLRMVTGVWSSTRRDTERLWIKDLISAVRAPINQLPFIHVCNFPFSDLAFREWSARKAGATTTPGSRSVSSSPTDIPDSLETEFRSASFSADQKGVV